MIGTSGIEDFHLPSTVFSPDAAAIADFPAFESPSANGIYTTLAIGVVDITEPDSGQAEISATLA